MAKRRDMGIKEGKKRAGEGRKGGERERRERGAAHPQKFQKCARGQYMNVLSLL